MNYDIKDFNTEVIERSRTIPVLVDFWAEWCGPCKTLGPILERLAQAANGEWTLAKVDTEVHRDAAAQYGIRSIPNVKLFVDGNVVNEFVGALPEVSVRAWLRKAIPDKHAKTLDQAELLLRNNETEKARVLAEGVLHHSPVHPRASLVLAKTFLTEDSERAIDILASIDEMSEYHDAALRLRTIVEFCNKTTTPEALPESSVKQMYLTAIEALRKNDFDSALEKFISVIREERYYDDDGARKACLAIFSLLGEEHEITMRHRRNFNSALY